MQVSWDGTVRAGRRGVRATAAQGTSIDLVRLLPSVFQGETKSAVVEISPLRFDARRQQLLLAKRVRLRLLFSGRETAESGRAHVGRRPKPDKPASGELLARLYTTGRGLYAVSFDQLFPGRRRGFLASELRLERQGEAQAFHLEPASDAFGPGGLLYFHADAEAASTDFSSETAFELVLARRRPDAARIGGAGRGRGRVRLLWIRPLRDESLLPAGAARRSGPVAVGEPGLGDDAGEELLAHRGECLRGAGGAARGLPAGRLGVG